MTDAVLNRIFADLQNGTLTPTTCNDAAAFRAHYSATRRHPSKRLLTVSYRFDSDAEFEDIFVLDNAAYTLLARENPNVYPDVEEATEEDRAQDLSWNDFVIHSNDKWIAVTDEHRTPAWVEEAITAAQKMAALRAGMKRVR